MPPSLLHRSCLLTVAILASTFAASAQNVKSGAPPKSSVCINLDSNYARIQAFLPSLAKSLLKNVSRQQKQVRVIAAGREPGDPVKAAKTKACEYLLELRLLETNSVSTGFIGGSFNRENTPEEERDRQQLDALRINYRLRSLANKELDVDDSDFVRYLEYPSMWDPAAFETAVDRAATRVAEASLENLPKR